MKGQSRVILKAQDWRQFLLLQGFYWKWSTCRFLENSRHFLDISFKNDFATLSADRLISSIDARAFIAWKAEECNRARDHGLSKLSLARELVAALGFWHPGIHSCRLDEYNTSDGRGLLQLSGSESALSEFSDVPVKKRQ